MKKIQTLIIGAGISGLTYAANTKEDYLIIEKENSVGGLCRTFYEKEFIWDYAGHFFHFATPEVKNLFETEIKEKDIVKCKKNTNINYYNESIDYPFQMNIHQLPKQEFIDCLYDLFNKEEKDVYANFEDMLYGKFGRSITEKFLKPYNEKLYACDLNELDTDAMGRFFPYADAKQIIDNMKQKNAQTYNSTFEYPKLGAQFFVNILANKIEHERVVLNAEVESIDPKNKIAKINGEKIGYSKLINTMPLNHFVKLLPKMYGDEICHILSCNKVLVFNLGFDKPANNSQIHWTYFPDKALNFYRVGYYNNILGTDKLSMYVEIGYKENAVINVPEQLELTLENLKKCNIVSEHRLIAHNALVINPGYVHITKESIKAVTEFRNNIEKDNIYTIGRYGKWTYCSIEDCIIDAVRLAKEAE